MRKQEDNGNSFIAEVIVNLSDKAYDESKSRIVIRFPNTSLEVVNQFRSFQPYILFICSMYNN